MKLKFKLLIIITIITFLFSSCSNENISSPSISSDKETTVNNNTPLSVTYMGYEDQYRFIGESASLFWMPDDNGPKVCDISDTLVEVMSAGYTGEYNIWLYVSFRTYDTPTNNRGWILESKTEKYTKENQELVKDIIVPKGTMGADKNENFVENYDQFGTIEKHEDDKVLVLFAGGKEIWYYEKDIKYPPFD